MVWPEIALGTILENVEPREIHCQQHVCFSWCCQGASFLWLFPKWSGQKLHWVQFWQMWSPGKFIVSNMWVFHGAVRVHHFCIFFQNGLARNCFRDNSGKCGAQRNPLSATCGFFMVLSGCIIFVTFPKMVWPEIALGTILVNVEPRKIPCQQHVGFSWCCQGASFLQLFQKWSGQKLP